MKDWSKADWVDPKYNWKPAPVPELPPRVLIDFATKCNLRCSMCPVWGLDDDKAIDSVEGIDAALTVTIENGVITRLEPGSARPGLVLAPAFVDPHVHLRTPGREDEETVASGTAAAAAGGYCAILAIPNTEPVVDSAAVLASLVEKARSEALVPVGFMAAISKGQEGAELTEMGELADEGAVLVIGEMEGLFVDPVEAVLLEDLP